MVDLKPFIMMTGLLTVMAIVVAMALFHRPGLVDMSQAQIAEAVRLVLVEQNEKQKNGK